MGILKPLIEVIGKNIFLIPDYQRSFAWEDKQVKDLIEDIKESLEENLKHYLGQIILREKEKLQDYKLYEVIDGQQRLTSLLLFLLSFHEIDNSNSLKKLKDDEIERFIDEFIAGFRDFTSSLKEILYQDSNNYLELLIYILKPTARLYPLLIGLYVQGNLDDEFLKLIEMADMYVYKADGGTTARADLYKGVISEIIFLKDESSKKQDVKGQLREFIRRLRGSCENIHTQLTKYILWNYEKEINGNLNLLDFRLYEEIQIEHVIPRTNDDYISYGFKDDRAEYDQFINKIGNLTILEERLNKKAENLSPKEKADIYLYGYGEGKGSILKINENLAHTIKHKYNGFTKREIEERTKELLGFIERKWSI